jgi:hypothetical protein
MKTEAAVVEIRLRLKERHLIEMRPSRVSDLWHSQYFTVWKRRITNGRSAGCTQHITIESYRDKPPTPELRITTESKHHIGIYRVVKDDAGKWYIEIFEEA